MTAAFSPDVVAAVCRHMDDDHADDGLLICRTLGGAADAVRAQARDVDGDGMVFAVTDAAGARRDVRVRFAQPVQQRAEVRRAVVELHERACAAAGVAPRGH